MSKPKTVCIIPSAGFGTRVGMKPNHSKEMIKDMHNKNKVIIDYALGLCKAFKMEPLVVTREEKKDLRQHLFNEGVKFIDIKVEGEWAQTVLKAKDHWGEKNLLILPDTRFQSFRCIEEIKTSLDLGVNASFALHKVTDPEKWGIIKDYTLLEKPKDLTGEQMAWGLIGWKREYGETLFSSKSVIPLDNVSFTYLNKFVDITRPKT